ncbi:hypothetical protein N657DRAFT_680462 [Parathielavia appendiculata]|uniref:Uncharacterized protein n=1 Tax=Parathielavia appendiculata TaxID=2587402 RepID=A0AAN6Z4B1_9PEZI|nr:hypothetical protein N657DRAFT_680462 [Parathielavia appendiculata]
MFIINKRSKTQHSSSGSGDQAKPRDKERSSNKGSCKGSTKGSKEGLPGSSSSGSGKKGKTGPEEPQEYEVLSTVIFKGNDNMNRRCALLIEHQNGTHDVWRRNMIVLHRSSKKWQIREETEENAANLERGAKKLFIKRFRVGKGADARNDTRLRDAICNAPVDNDNEEWNYLNWLDGALIRLVKEKLLTKEEKEKIDIPALPSCICIPHVPPDRSPASAASK